MDISLKQFRYFVAAAETGKISAAAVECNVSQSAVTVALKGLEDQIGRQLFQRHSAGVSLTQEGYEFLEKARVVLASVSAAMRPCREHKVEARPTLRLGVSYIVVGYLLGPQLARFRQRHPSIHVSIQQMRSSELEEAIICQEIDLGMMIVTHVQDSEAVATDYLFRSKRRLWLSNGHPLLTRDIVSLNDVSTEPFVMLNYDETKEAQLAYWREAKTQPNIYLETSSIEAVRTHVGLGMGVTVLSDLVYRPWSLEGHKIETRVLENDIPTLDVGLVWGKRTRLNESALEFRKFCQDSFIRA